MKNKWQLSILFVVSVFQVWAQPSNNTCSGAIQIAVQNAGSCTPSGGYSTVGATNSLSNACMGGVFRDTWYKFTPTTSAVVLEGIGFWTGCKIELFDGCGGNSLECYAWPNTFSITWHGLTANHTYFFRIGTLPSYGEGNIDLCLRSVSPLNDECNNAITLPVNTGNGNCDLFGSFSVVGATSSTSNSCMNNQYNDTWYKFTVPLGMNEVSLEFVNSWSSNNKIEVFDVCGGSSVFCDFVEDYVPLAISGLVPGQEYWLRIGTQITSISNAEEILLCLWGVMQSSPYDDCPGALLTVESSCNFTNLDNSTWTESYLPTACFSLEFFEDGYIQINIPQSGDFHLDFGNVPTGQDFEVYQGISCLGPSIYCGFTTGNSTHTINAPSPGWYLIRTGHPNGDPTGDIEICVWQSAPLPISLFSLQAQPQKTATQLTWRTASESQNSHFEVEHSRNGVSYQSIGQVPGQGTTNEPHDYAFPHERPGPGTHYYRLRHVDFDGNHSYSHIVSVDQAGLADLSGLALWPNPTTGLITLGFEIPEGTCFVVSDALGRTLIKGELLGTQMDLSELQPSQYWVTVVSGLTSNTLRIVKE